MIGTIGKNGILLSSNPTIEDIADSLQYMVGLSDESAIVMHKNACMLWNEHFDAISNSKAFSDYIMHLFEGGTKRVVLITDGYPYGGERPFIQYELRELLRHVDVILVPLLDKNNCNNKVSYGFETSELEHRLDVVQCHLDWSFIKCIPFFFSYFFDNKIREERKEVFSGTDQLSVLYESMKYYAWAKRFSGWIDKHIDTNICNEVYYTYWYRHTTLGICLNHSLRGQTVITRTHGYDLYDERVNKTNRQPFRAIMNGRLKNIVFACSAAKEYYLKRYGLSDDNRYRVSYIGTEKKSETTYSRSDKDESGNVFRLVSCSSLIELKRVDRIVDALLLISKRKPEVCFEWVHFGNGPLREQLEKRIMGLSDNGNDNLRFFFMGDVDNDLIHEYYSNNHVDCFITTSSSEGGCPVSIQEALAYGIPVIGTDIGGIPEAIECLAK